jgi:hypothetical protein
LERGESLTPFDRAKLMRDGMTALEIADAEKEAAVRPKPLTEDEVERLWTEHGGE